MASSQHSGPGSHWWHRLEVEIAMEERLIMASRFKERCLALLDLVAQTKVPVVVTKHGKPVAKLVPIDEPAASPTMGSVRLLADGDQAYFSTGEAWAVEEPSQG